MPADRQGNVAGGLAYPALDEEVSREVLAQLFFAEFGPSTTTFVYPAEIATVTLLPEPKGISLEELTETSPGR